MGKMSSLFRFYFCHLILIKFRTPGQGCQLQHRLQLFRRDQGHHQRDRSLSRQQKPRDRRGDVLQVATASRTLPSTKPARTTRQSSVVVRN